MFGEEFVRHDEPHSHEKEEEHNKQLPAVGSPLLWLLGFVARAGLALVALAAMPNAVAMPGWVHCLVTLH